MTRHLVIQPELVGALHEFIFEGYKIRIKLPSKAQIPTEPLQGDLLFFNVYKEANGRKIPRDFYVRAVDVEVCVPEPILVTKDILNQPPNAFDIVPETQQAQLNKLTENYGAIAEKAFDFWLRVLRWKCGESAIGRPEIRGSASGWSTYLITEPGGQRIWIAPGISRVKRYKAVTGEIWNHADSALKKGLKPPVFVEFEFDAIEHIQLGDLQRGIVDMAVACETFLRMLVAQSLPSNLNRSVSEYVDDTNIRLVLRKFVPEILTATERKQLKKIESKLHELFDVRNDILHKGRIEQLTSRDCHRFLEATSKLLALRDS